ncbi:30S ribosomal protein S11-like [Dioscorea cayenensis subsp. rotundata]|uniref:30S ribosomal protein S11-like n=1 Tax=Dioscorea cayennensis subsp. rotundata TaxID=55577 RepID=A0AB40C671_DIOCR|nr:30S ribosomal protein S11-like [Dioscorea cayenensis subsp. rotundata]
MAMLRAASRSIQLSLRSSLALNESLASSPAPLPLLFARHFSGSRFRDDFPPYRVEPTTLPMNRGVRIVPEKKTFVVEAFEERATLNENIVEKTRGETERLGLAGAGSFKSMNFVQSILLSEKDEQYSRKKNTDFVHVLLKKNKTFVTVTDARGNKKTGASAGCLEERKGRSRLSRYAAEATAEHVGRSARKMGLKSVVMKVKGSTFIRKKNKVILSWREGFQGEGVRDQSQIMYIHDVTQLPHNGCRLPKKRRV